MKFKKLITTVLILVFLAVLVFFNLPLEKRRGHDIRFGNKLIANIENYQNRFGHLPRNWDWETLEELGFEINDIGAKPDYMRINDSEYQLTFLDSFDGPYLLYNSTEKIWKKDFPNFPLKKIMEKDYPWTTDITEAAKDAILISIDNMQKPEAERDPNFPTDKCNMPFVLKEKKDFQLIGYTTKNNSDVCEIEFQPVGEYKSGPRFTVEFDLKKEKPICVYMKPDA